MHRTLLASFRSISSTTECATQTQLEAAANALQFPWTVALPVEPSNPGSCSSEAEAAIQPKTEVLDDCDFVCEMPRPSKAARLTCESEMAAAGEVKSEDESAARMCVGALCIRPASDSEQPPAFITSAERCEVQSNLFWGSCTMHECVVTSCERKLKLRSDFT